MFRSLSARRRLLLLAVALLAITGSLAGLLVGLRSGEVAGPQEGPVPVVLVHGYDGTPVGLGALAARLRASGRQVVTVALPDRGTGDIEVSAQVLARSVDGTRATRVDLVGYSAGGIVVRDYLGQPGRAASARHVVLLGTPNHGTQLAGLASDLVRDPLAIGLVMRAVGGGMTRQPTSSDCAATRAAGAPGGSGSR